MECVSSGIRKIHKPKEITTFDDLAAFRQQEKTPPVVRWESFQEKLVNTIKIESLVYFFSDILILQRDKCLSCTLISFPQMPQ